jgi:fatty-acyl-CoA synthase
MNLGQWISKRAKLNPRQPFLLYESGDTDNQQFDALVNCAASLLAAVPVNKGDRVAVMMENASAFLVLFFACAKRGAIMVPLNPRQALPELTYMIEDCAPALLVHSEDDQHIVDRLTASTKGPFRTLSIGSVEEPAQVAFSRHLSAYGEMGAPTKSSVDDGDPLLIVYTSGTTGNPKGAVLTHGNVLFGAIHSLLNYGIDSGYRSLVVAPLYHIGALAASVTPIVYAGGALMLHRFEYPSETLRTIMRHRINYLFAVPLMYEMMARSAAWDAADLSHVHFFIAGGAPMTVDLIHTYRDKGVHFAQGYGMTETLRITALELADIDRKPGSVGKETFHTHLRIVDEAGSEVPPDSVGEIVVNGPTVCSGYWNRADLTNASFKDGWFFTGDLGYRDSEGYLFLKGRKIDLIISGGRNIYAVEVERAIEKLPQVSEAAVTGVPAAGRGELVTAFIRLHEPDPKFNQARLRQLLQGQLAQYKIPRKVVVVEDFPRNHSGKIIKHRLVENFL